MSMDLNGHPCSFLDSFQSHVITNRAKRLVFLVEHGPKVWNSAIRLCTISVSIFKFCSFHKVYITEYYNNPCFYSTLL